MDFLLVKKINTRISAKIRILSRRHLKKISVEKSTTDIRLLVESVYFSIKYIFMQFNENLF